MKDKTPRTVYLHKVDSSSDREQIFSVIKLCQSIKKADENGFGWPASLMHASDFQDFVEKLDELNHDGEFNLQKFQEQGYVAQDYWWIFDEDHQAIGLGKVRTVLTPKLLRYGGHIGYGIGRHYRNQGYGTAALQMLLIKACSAGLKDILLTVDADNFASRRVIERNHGRLFDVIRRDDKDIARYWVTID